MDYYDYCDCYSPIRVTHKTWVVKSGDILYSTYYNYLEDLERLVGSVDDAVEESTVWLAGEATGWGVMRIVECEAVMVDTDHGYDVRITYTVRDARTGEFYSGEGMMSEAVNDIWEVA